MPAGTTLYIVRHGQASFGAADYDRLSSLGETQARHLGTHWHRCGERFDAIYSGRMVRQRVSAERALETLAAEPAPPLAIEPALDEYDHVGLIRAYAPRVLRAHPELEVTAPAPKVDPRRYQAIFEKVIAAWHRSDDGESPIAETWDGFRTRCRTGLERIAATGATQVALFTSGGVIATALQAAMGLSDEATFSLNWRIHNASVHVFRLGRHGLALHRFNDVAHLQVLHDPKLLTWR